VSFGQIGSSKRCQVAITASQRGFTLVEMVVALALMSLLGLIIIESLRLAQRSYEKVSRAEMHTSELVLSQQLIRHLFESAYPIERSQNAASVAVGLVGGSDTVELLSLGSQAMGSAGHVKVRIGLRRRDDGLFDIVAQLTEAQANTRMGERAVHMPTESILLSQVKQARWSFLSMSSEAGSGNTEWKNEWQGTQLLPAAVQLQVEFPQNDARVWPRFIATPRITHDANCEFDVVAQNCRALP
jgi:general secretion pathway protein J